MEKQAMAIIAENPPESVWRYGVIRTAQCVAERNRMYGRRLTLTK